MRFTGRAEDGFGYPNWAFEAFYQQGKSCYVWGLTRIYVRQALRAAAQAYTDRFGPIAYWQLRAFAYGLHGGYEGQSLPQRIPADYRWPAPPDAAWLAVVCLYPDGVCELDFAHPVSRRFWSEDNGFPDLPPVTGPTLNALWFEELGFTILRMNPAIRLTVATDRPKHLKPI